VLKVKKVRKRQKLQFSIKKLQISYRTYNVNSKFQFCPKNAPKLQFPDPNFGMRKNFRQAKIRGRGQVSLPPPTTAMSPVSEDGYYYAAQHDGQMVEWEQVGLVHLDVDVNVADKLE